MDLAELKFKVNTDELALAAKKIEALGTAVSDLNDIQKQSATINREEAKASKDKVQSDTAQVQAKNKLTEATENSTKASKAAVSETDRLNKLTTNLENTFKDLSKGFTRGESSVLNLARSFGASAEGIERVKAELAKIGTLIKDPFDAAIGSVRSINQEFDKVTNRTNLAAQGIVLTTKQLSEYSRVATEISAKILSAGLDPTSGKGLADFTKGLERVQQKYLGIAESVNIANNAEKERQRIAKEAQGPTSGSMDQAVGMYYKEQARAMRESSSAAAYLEKEMKRVDFVLNEVNAELQLSTSNRLLKFEESLKRTGVTGTQAASQIEAYRKSLQKIDETRAFKRQTDDLKVYQDKVNYVTRAVGPQLTDIFSGLLTGQQSLYTIAVQQGGQLADQFSLAGIEANKMGGILASALPNMYTNIANIGKAFGQMAVGGLSQLGAKFIEVAAASIPFSDGLQGLRNRMIAMDGVANSSSSTLRAFDAALKGASIFAGALAVALAGVSIAVVLETYKIIKAESDLSKALAMSGAAMNLTKEQAVGYAESLTTAGTTTREVMNIISEMAKTGVIGSESIAMITKSALDMNKYAGVAIEDTVKSFAKMQGKPVEALSDLALKTGDVNQETIKHVESLVKQGDQAGATAVAMKALADSNSEVTERLIADSAPIELLWLDIKSAISLASQEVYELATNSSLVDTFRTAWQTVHVIISEVWYVLKTTGNEIGGIAAQLAAVARLDFSAAAAIGRSMKDDAVAGRKAQDAYTKSIIEGNNARSAGAKISNDQRALNRQAELDRIAKEKKDKENKDKRGGVKISDEQRAINKAKEDFIDIQNKLNGVNTKFNNQLEGQQLLLSKGLITTEEYAQVVIALTQQQKVYTDEVTKQEKAQRELNKAWDDAVKAQAKKDDDFFKQFDEMTKQRQELEMQTSEIQFQLTLVGKTADEQKVMTREFQLQNKLKNVQVELERELLKIAAEKKDPADVLMFNQEAYRIAAEKIKAINAGVALEFSQDMQREFNSIKATITDAVVTALFDGGKAGSKKLRDSIVAAFRNKITIVVDAVVNTALNSGLSALGIGGTNAGGSSLSSLAGNAVSDYGQSAIIGSLMASPAAYGAAIGTTSIGVGSQAAMLAAQTGTFGTAGVAATASAAGSTAGSLMSGLSAAGPYLAAAVAIYMIAKSLDDSGTYHTGALSQYSATGGAATSQTHGAFGMGFGGVDYSEGTQKLTGEISKSIVTMLDATAVTFGKEAGYKAATAFADDSSGDGAWGGLLIQKLDETIINWDTTRSSKWAPREFSDAEAGQKEYLNAIAADTRNALESIGLPTWATKMLDAVGNAPTLESIAAVVDQINATKVALKSLGEVFPELINISDTAIDNLITVFGGLGNFAASLQSYYSNFYTESEQIERATANTSKAFAELGITMPKVDESLRTWYRGIVDSALALDQGDIANAKATASVLALQGAVNELAPAVDSLKDAMDAINAIFNEVIDESLAALEDAIASEKKAIDSLINSTERKLNSLQEQEKAVEGSLGLLTEVFNTLGNNIRELRNEVESTFLQNTQEARDVISAAMSSNTLPSNDILVGAIETIRSNLDNTTYRTKADQDRDRILLSNDLNRLQKIAGVQISTQDRQLLAIRESISVQEQQLAQLKDQSSKLDGILENAKSQVQSYKDEEGTNELKSVAAALTDLIALLSSTKAATSYFEKNPDVATAYASDSYGLSPEDFAKVHYGKYGQTEGRDSATTAPSNNSSKPKSYFELYPDVAEAYLIDSYGMSQIGYSATHFTNFGKAEGRVFPGFAKGGSYMGGLALVGEEGPELINFRNPGQVYTAGQTASTLSGGSRLEELVIKLNENIEGLRFEVRADVSHNSKIAKILDRVSPDGQSLSVTVV